MRLRFLAIVFFFVMPLAALAQGPATLTIDTASPVASVSPTLYGIMTEEINYSYDGGLYGEQRKPAERHDGEQGADHVEEEDADHAQHLFGLRSEGRRRRG